MTLQAFIPLSTSVMSTQPVTTDFCSAVLTMSKNILVSANTRCTQRRLYLLLLPYRASAKLKFTVCPPCCEAESQGLHIHSDEQGNVMVVCCTVELNKAIEKGYRIAKIYKVWHFPER